MDVLWISHFLLYPETGFGALQRSRNLLRAVAKYHRVSLISLYRESDLPAGKTLDDAKNSLLEFCDSVELIENKNVDSTLKKGMLFLGSQLKNLPYSTEMYRSPLLEERIRATVKEKQIELIHSDTIGLADDTLVGLGVPAVLNHHNVESHMMQRRAERASNPLMKYLLNNEMRSLEGLEKLYCPQYATNFAVSQIDALRFKSVAPSLSVEVVENGVDCSYYQSRESHPKNSEMIFVGSMDWYPNSDAMVYFHQSILPKILERSPEAHLTLVGKSVPAEIQRDSARIKCTGFVPDIRPLVRDARLFICPIREGGGTRLKLLDAFAQGIPVVSTTVGAEGLDVTHREHLLLADSPQEFCDAVVELLEDDSLCESLAANARSYVERRFSFDVLGAKLSQLYQSVSGQGDVRNSRNI